jgi:hypothetical protein
MKPRRIKISSMNIISAQANSSPAMEENFRGVLPHIINAFKSTGLSKSHIESFNVFALKNVPLIVMENSDINIENDKKGTSHKISFGNVQVRRPFVRETDGIFHTISK